MMWALIFMATTGRVVVPEYVEIYQTRQECVAKIPQTGFLQMARAYCAPIESKK